MERGQRRAASQVAFLAAACAHGARDPKLTRVLLRRALLRELEPPSDLQGLRPDFLGLLERMRKQSLDPAARGARRALQAARGGGIDRRRRAPMRAHAMHPEHASR